MNNQNLTTDQIDSINKPVTLKPINDELDPGAVPGGSTINTFTECAYDGAELRIDRRNRGCGVTGRR